MVPRTEPCEHFSELRRRVSVAVPSRYFTWLRRRVSVAASSRHQADKKGLDLYIFVSIQFDGREPKRIWIIGQKDRDSYFEEARFIKKGEPEGNNGFISHADMYNLITTELDPLDDSLLPQKQ